MYNVQSQAQDVVALAIGYARTDNRVYVQNTTAATIHMARSGDEGRTIWLGLTHELVLEALSSPFVQYIASTTFLACYCVRSACPQSVQ